MIVNIKVHPKSKHQSIEKSADGYKVHLTSAPEKGKANKELFQIFSEYFGISKNQMLILRGATSRNKIIKIDTFRDRKTNLYWHKLNTKHQPLNTIVPNHSKSHLSRVHCWDRYTGRGR